MKRFNRGVSCILILAFILLMFPFGVFAGGVDVYPDEYSDDFKKISSDGTLVINAKKPTEVEDSYGSFLGFMLPAYFYRTYIYDDMHVSLDWDKNLNEEFENDKLSVCLSTGTVLDMGEKKECHTLDVTYTGVDNDKLETIKTYTDKMKKMSGVLDDDNAYITSDLELINFFASGYNLDDDIHNFIHFSSEFNKAIGYGNLVVDLYIGAGANGLFRNVVFGEAAAMQEGVLYFNIGTLGSLVLNNLYVPNDTDDADMMNTAQERIDKYLKGSKMEGKLVLKEGNTINASNLAKYIADKTGMSEDAARQSYNTIDWSEPSNPVSIPLSDDEFVNTIIYDNKSVADGDKYDFDNKYYILENTVTNDEVTFLIVRDSDKMINDMNFKSSDIKRNISVETASSAVPSDTSLVVEDKGDSLNEELGLIDGISYDLKLYSVTNNKKISDANGEKFTVNIPVDEDLANENLVAYYIDKDGKVHEYKVTVDGNTASFETDHFSTYTIGYKGVGNSENVPNTSDNIYSYLILSILSLISVIGSSLYLKKQLIF